MDVQQAIWNQNDARVIAKIAREEVERFIKDPTEENRFWAIHSQNSASDAAHCALYVMGVVEWVVHHPGTGRDGYDTSYSDFTPTARPAQ